MKKNVLQFIIPLISIVIFAQDHSQQKILDSIIQEANLLYNYEKATWHASDLAFSNKEIAHNIGTYVIYHSNDTVVAVFSDKNSKNQLAKYSFLNTNLKEPVLEELQEKPLSNSASKLFEIKNKILGHLNANASEYGFGFESGFNPNPVLIPANEGYRFYIIIGTPKKNVIPFGNDYLFNIDKDGKVLSWKKFHKSLIATNTKGPNNEPVVAVVHSHLEMTPYISATDICTFRLYGVDLFGMNTFMVTSTALNKLFTYDASENKIAEEDL